MTFHPSRRPEIPSPWKEAGTCSSLLTKPHLLPPLGFTLEDFSVLRKSSRAEDGGVETERQKRFAAIRVAAPSCVEVPIRLRFGSLHTAGVLSLEPLFLRAAAMPNVGVYFPLICLVHNLSFMPSWAFESFGKQSSGAIRLNERSQLIQFFSGGKAAKISQLQFTLQFCLLLFL